MRREQQNGKTLEEAAQTAVDKAIENDLLDGFFKREKSEVMATLIDEYDEEKAMAAFFEEGKREGRESEKKRLAGRMLSKGFDKSLIADLLETDLEELERILNENE